MQLGYTILYVDDVPATLDAWKAAFGLTERFRTPEGDYGELDTGSTTLSFAGRELGRSHFEQEDIRALFDGKAQMFEIGLITDDVPGAYAKAVESGMRTVVEPITKPWGQVVGWVTDHNGILIEIAAPMAQG
ncbi:MAG: VOC family protein [Deltaproteobacteria bacterium]|nr:VOC family protein [Deltaproteobacteria bacterium]